MSYTISILDSDVRFALEMAHSCNQLFLGMPINNYENAEF